MKLAQAYTCKLPSTGVCGPSVNGVVFNIGPVNNGVIVWRIAERVVARVILGAEISGRQ